jgi:Tat protein translocase TatB subunit
MFGIGLPELIIIMVVALIVIGPSKLPDLARALGKGMAEFRKATEDIKESLDLEQEFDEARGELADAIGDVNRPLDMEDLDEVDMPKYQDYDEVLEAHEKEMTETSQEQDPEEDSSREDRSKNGT